MPAKKSRVRPCLLFVLGMQPTKIGGVEKFLRALVVALDTRGWDSVLCFDGEVSDEFRRYFDLPFVSLDRVDHQGNLGFGAAGSLWRVLRKYKPRVFVYAFHGAMRCFPWLAKLAGVRGIFFNDHSSRALGMVARPLPLPKRIIGRMLTAPLTAIISVSEFTRRTGEIFGITSAPNIVIYNGIEMVPCDSPAGQRLREKYAIAANALVVTQVCWMVDAKGVQLTLKALHRLKDSYENLRGLFVGGGAKLEEYRALSKSLGLEQIACFTDIISDPVGAGVLDASDVFCQPSLWQEAFGLAVIEAMSKKVPVIVSDVGGLREVVSAGAGGVRVPVNDFEALASELDRLLRDPALRARTGEAGYSSVQQRFQLEKTVQQYVDLFLSN